MRNPDSTKNTVTPNEPFGKRSRGAPTCRPRTIRIDTARKPSRAGIRCGLTASAFIGESVPKLCRVTGSLDDSRFREPKQQNQMTDGTIDGKAESPTGCGHHAAARARRP